VKANPAALALMWVRTEPGRPQFEVINDEQLIALFRGRPVALVHRNRSEAELVLVNPSDQNGFQVP
jgi:hypothetical protein